MAYLIYTLTFAFLFCATILYATRSIWKPFAPPIPYLTAPGSIPEPLYNLYASVGSVFESRRNHRGNYQAIPQGRGGFRDDAEAGFSSAAFNLADNIEAGDSRAGLDDRGKKEISRLMETAGVGFDEARRMWMEERFGRENISRDGRPLDRKAVMFDR